MTDDLNAILDAAYRTFRVGKPSDPCVCTACCMDPEMARRFFEPEPRDLTALQLDAWFEAAVAMELPHDTWSYLLPRILERLAKEGCGAPVGIEVTLNRYPTGRKELWSEAQWNVLDQFQRAFLHAVCASDLDKRNGVVEYINLDDVLCMFALAGWKVEDLFEQVLALPPDVLIPKLYRDWCERSIYPTVWVTSFWSKGHDPLGFWTSLQMVNLVTEVAVTGEGKLAKLAMVVSEALPLRPTLYRFENGIPK